MKLRLVTLLALLGLAVVPVSLLAQAAQTTQNSQVPCCPSGTSGCPSGPCTTGGGGGGGGFMADISPYAGYVWPQSFNGIGNFQGSQIIGARGGIFVTSGFEIGGNYSWNNHFQPTSGNVASAFAGSLGFPQGGVKANLWEVEFTYNFGPRSIFGSTAFKPYLVGGAGGLTTYIKHANAFVLNTNSFFVQGATPAGLQSDLKTNNLQDVLPGINTTKGVVFVGEPTGTSVFVPNDMLTGETFMTFSYGGGIKATRLWGPMGVFGDFRGRTVPNFFGHANTWPELSAGLNFTWGER